VSTSVSPLFSVVTSSSHLLFFTLINLLKLICLRSPFLGVRLISRRCKIHANTTVASDSRIALAESNRGADWQITQAEDMIMIYFFERL
jgi:hypothetical protein